MAIELQGAEDKEPRVFTPFNCRPEIWQVRQPSSGVSLSDGMISVAKCDAKIPFAW